MTPPVPGPTSGLNAAVAAQLRAEIAAANLSEKALAELADVNYTSLRRWLGREKGNERHIDVAVLAAIAKALNLDPAEIIQRAEQRMAADVATVTNLSDHRGTVQRSGEQIADAALDPIEGQDQHPGEPEE